MVRYLRFHAENGKRGHRQKPIRLTIAGSLGTLSTKWLVENAGVGMPDKPGIDRRQALVEATFGLIAEKGFEGLRLRDVSARVGIDHSTLHHYFATKNDLVAAVVEYAISQFVRTIQSEEGGEVVRTEVQIERLGRLVSSWPELFRVLREVDLRAMRDPAVQGIMRPYLDRWRNGLAGRLRAEIDAGHLSPALTPEAGAELIMATLRGATLRPEHSMAVHEQLLRLLTT
jgi:AcrR family transcriptional regulator